MIILINPKNIQKSNISLFLHKTIMGQSWTSSKNANFFFFKLFHNGKLSKLSSTETLHDLLRRNSLAYNLTVEFILYGANE